MVFLRASNFGHLMTDHFWQSGFINTRRCPILAKHPVFQNALLPKFLKQILPNNSFPNPECWWALACRVQIHKAERMINVLGPKEYGAHPRVIDSILFVAVGVQPEPFHGAFNHVV